VRASFRNDALVASALLLATLLMAAQIAAQLVDFGVFDLSVGWLNSNHHASLFGIASLAAQGAAAAAAALRSAAPPRRAAWAAGAVLIAALLVLRLAVTYGTAPLIGPVTLTFLLLWWLGGGEPAPARPLVRAGLFLLVFSFVVHAAGPSVVSALGGGDWAYQLKGVLKHSAELGGWMLVATGVAAPASRARSRWAG
jgi:hypothetical protein